MYVWCMYVRNVFTIEIYIVYVPFWHVQFMMQSRAMQVEARRTVFDAITSPEAEIWKMVNYSTEG